MRDAEKLRRMVISPGRRRRALVALALVHAAATVRATPAHDRTVTMVLQTAGQDVLTSTHDGSTAAATVLHAAHQDALPELLAVDPLLRSARNLSSVEHVNVTSTVTPTFMLVLYCIAGAALLAAAFLGCTMLGLQGSLAAESRGLPRTILTLYFVLVVIKTAAWTALIPTSYDLVTSMVSADARNEMLSGLYLSSLYIGDMVVALALVPLTNAAVWDQWCIKWITAGGTALWTLAMVSLAATSFEPSTEPSYYRLVLLIVLSMLRGFDNVPFICTRLLVSRVTAPSSQATISVLSAMFKCIGAGLGPMVPTALSLLPLPHASSAATMTATSCVLMSALTLGWLLLFLLLVPSRNDSLPEVRAASPTKRLEDTQSTGSGTDAQRQLHAEQRKVFWHNLTMAAERGFLVSGLEVTTSLVLEIEFGVPLVTNGATIGATFLIGVPVLFLWLLAKQLRWLSLDKLLVAASACIAVLCTFIFRSPTELLQLGPVTGLSLLLAAGSLIYPTAFTVSGTIEGIAVGYTAIPGSCFYTTSFTLILADTAANIGRFAAAPFCRQLTDIGGRDAYAAVQLGIALMSLCSSVCVAPAVSSLLANDDAVNRRALRRSGERTEGVPWTSYGL